MRERFFNLQQFAIDNVATTQNYVNPYTGAATAWTDGMTMSPEMKTYYDTELLENARPNLVHAQFGKRAPLPAHKGKNIEFRRFNTLNKAAALTDGVIPSASKFGSSALTASITQYGDYVSISDQLDTHAIDPVLLEATKELGAAAGITLDEATRDAIMSGTNVMYCPKIDASTGVETAVTSRAGLDATAILTPKQVNKAVTILKKANAPKINGKYVAIIHPSVAYDLRQSDEWIEAHKYAAVTELFNGEIGELHGVRFVETTEAKILGPSFGAGLSRYTLKTALDGTGSTTIAVDEAISSAEATAITAAITAGNNKIYVGGKEATLSAVTAGNAGSATFTTTAAVKSVSKGAVVCGSGAGADGSAVYACLFLGQDAYGIVDPEGAGLQMITKPASQVGGPLEQFSTAGYKLSTVAKILYEDRILRVESGSSYSDVDEAN